MSQFRRRSYAGLSSLDGCDRELVGFLEGHAAAGLTHAELEERLRADGFELLRQLYQDHLELRAERLERLGEVTAASCLIHRSVEPDHDRRLATVLAS